MTIKTKITNYVLLPILLLPAVVNAAQEPIIPTTPEQWRSITERDIEAAYSITAQNHPGMFDVNNPTFPDLLKNELDKYNLKHIKIEPIILTTSGLMIKSSNF